ncbi:Cyclic AMP-dependent transcription factor ATF-2 [Eumeta japonica]|uniref:Cyclic AMP-dependent transcription factor ATF-2 n=1 Tax=Eumeta variegata TaxID=151549 RepID=A0A4C1XMH8_EUMVA|nr:Cyclic AMP-dependent transcription factor ATF-2 [Eumeta japonica]
MVEPVKPFACCVEDCGMTFTNEDHLHVHTKKHDMMLQLGLEQKAAFVADQTPTPTRFIRNCEEVGLFQDLQNVNPFDEGFKRAMETKAGILSLDNGIPTTVSDDVLHTPQMVFPNLSDGTDTTLYSSNNNQRNIIISRSSSDESGVIREYETTTISKLTNEVTTTHTSRVIGEKIITTDDVAIVRHEELAQNVQHKEANETSVSYKNNVIKIHSNIEIIQNQNKQGTDCRKNIPVLISCSEPSKATSVITEDVLLADSTKLTAPNTIPKGPIMSQKSIDYVVDSFTSDINCKNNTTEKDVELIGMLKKNFQNVIQKKSTPIAEQKNLNCTNNENTNDISKPDDLKSNKRQPKRKINENRPINDDYITNYNDFEAIIKLPGGKSVRLKAVEHSDNKNSSENDTKQTIKKNLMNKVNRNTTENLPILQNVVTTVPTATLLPVTLVKQVNAPIIVSQQPKVPIPAIHLPAKTRTRVRVRSDESIKNNINGDTDNSILQDNIIDSNAKNVTMEERRNAASKRYRERLKVRWELVQRENKRLSDLNNSLIRENTKLKEMLLNHIKTCPNWDDLRMSNVYQKCTSNISSSNNQKKVSRAGMVLPEIETTENIAIIKIVD